MAEFERKDFVSDEALMAPLVLKKNWEEYLKTMKEVRAAGLGAASAPKGGGDSSTSTKKLKEETIKLTKEQQLLVQVQNKIAVAVAKDNDEYRKQEQALIKLNVELKNKNALGEKEALQVNKLNSSLKELEAALASNRVAYGSLRTEEERTSAAGLKLLDVIQDQKEGVDEIKQSMGDFTGNVGNYTKSILKAHEAIKAQEDDTTKLIVAQKGLDKTTEEGKKAYDHLNVAIQNNITQINIYRKEAGMAATSTKELDKSLEATGTSSGGLGEALGKISPGLKSAYEGAVSFGKALWALATNPAGIIILALVAAIAGLARYFTASSEGQDKWNKVLAVGAVLLDQFLDLLEGVGKALVTLWEEPEKALNKFLAFLDPVITIFKELGEGIADIFTFKGTGNLKKALLDIKKLAVSVWEEAADAAHHFYDESERRAAIALKITEEENKLRKDLIQDIIDDSRTELKVSKDLQIVHDHLRNTDEGRLKALREANQLLEDQANGDIELAQQEQKAFEDSLALEKLGLDTTMMVGKERRKIIDEAIEGGKIDYDNRQKVADLIVKINKTEQNFLDGQKRRLSEEFTLVNEIAKRKQDQIKAEQVAIQNLNKWRLEDSIEANQKIIDNEFIGLAEQTNAIADINEARVQLAIDASNKELEIAREAAKQRVQLTDEELKEIFANKALSFQEQIALQEQYIAASSLQDEAYITEATKIEQAKFAEINKINAESAKLAEENVFKVLQRDAKNLDNTLNTATNYGLVNLEKQFAANEVSLADYNKRKLQIQQEGEASSIASQIEYLRKQAELLQIGGEQRIQLENQISKLELASQQNKNALKLEGEQQVQAGLQELSTTGVGLAMETINNFFAAEEEARQVRLEHIQEVMDQELLAAGDNEAAKVAIKNKAEAETQKIRLQQAAAARKQAIFEKTVAVISIAINTAKGIGQALGTYPPPASFVLAAITGVLGALQIAAVLSKPIPSYAVGVESHKGGIARVGEEGPELVTLPGGKQFLTPDGDTYMDLPAGSKVDTYKDTVNQLALRSLPHIDRQGNRSDVEGFDKLGKKIDENTLAIKNKKEQHWNISKSGMQAMVKNAETRSYFMDQLYR